jgi:hypothetical protein
VADTDIRVSSSVTRGSAAAPQATSLLLKRSGLFCVFWRCGTALSVRGLDPGPSGSENLEGHSAIGFLLSGVRNDGKLASTSPDWPPPDHSVFGKPKRDVKRCG